METTSNVAIKALEDYLSQDYKSCIQNLNKIKSMKTLNDKSTYKINHNTILCEYLPMRMSNLQNFISKLEDIINELKNKTQQANKNKGNARKTSGISDDDNTEKSNSNENEDDSIIKYNYAIALYIQGKKGKSIEILKELLKNKDMICDLLVYKISLLYLEMALNAKDYQIVKNLINLLDTSKNYLPNYTNHEGKSDNVDIKADIPTMPLDKFKENIKGQNSTFYNPIIFGADVYKHGANPVTINKNEFDFITLIYKVYLLIQVKEFDNAKTYLSMCKKYMKTFVENANNPQKSNCEEENMYSPAMSPIISRQATYLYKFAKATLAYNSKLYKKAIRLMHNMRLPSENPHLNNSTTDIFQNYVCLTLNNIACSHMKMGKSNIAIMYLLKATNIIQKTIKDKEANTAFSKSETLVNIYVAQKYPYILYNLAMAFFQTGKYEEAADAWLSIAEYMVDNPRLWYRIGICYLNKYHMALKENAAVDYDIICDMYTKKRNNLYQSILDLQIVTSNDEERSSLPTESAKTMKRGEEIQPENKENFIFTRYVLNTKENLVQDHEEDLNPIANPSYKTFKNSEVNKNNEGQTNQIAEKQLRQWLDKASKCFRDALLILKKRRIKELKEPELQINMKSANDYNSGENPDLTMSETEKNEENKENKKSELIIKTLKATKELDDLLQSTYVNLAYVSLCLGEMNAAANFAQEALELQFINEENKFLCLIYLVEYYCSLGNNQDALNWMNKVSLSQNIQVAARNILGATQTYMAPNMNNKIIIYINLAMVHILNNNLTGAQNAIGIALANLESTQGPNSQIPIPLLNLMIYINIRNDNYTMALQLLKRRRMLQNSKILLRIMK